MDLEMAGRAKSPDNASATYDPEILVDVRNLYVRFQLRRGVLARHAPEVRAVDGVDLTIRKGQTVGLVGETGSGKSTIAHVISGLVRPSIGTVVMGQRLARGGPPLSRRPSDVGADAVQTVLQDPYSSLNPRMKLRDIIAEPLTVVGRVGREEANTRVTELMRLVGLPPSKRDSYPHQFSGGQRQRIAVARALSSRPQLIVLDEPTSALDVSVRAQILNLLRDIQEQLGVTYLVISHDFVTVAYLATKLVVMHLGRFVEMGPTDAVLKSPRHPYTVELLSSVPRAGESFLRARRIAAPVAGGSGCKYAPGCELREALGNPVACSTDDPRLKPVGPDHLVACHFSGSRS